MRKFFALLSLFLLVLCGKIYGQVPIVTAFNPGKGGVGAKIVISGENFNPVATANIVLFGSIPATILSASSTKLEVTVPAGATFDPITVSTGMLQAQSRTSFYPTFGDNSADFLSSISFVPTNTIQRLMQRSSHVRSFLSHDLNMDGYPDMIASEYMVNLRLFKHTGDVMSPFLTNRTLSLSTGYYPASGDLNGDGKLDFAYVAPDAFNVRELYILTNTSNSELSFKEAKIKVAGSINQYLKIADLDNDGRADIVNFNLREIAFLRNTSVNNVLSFSPVSTTFPYPDEMPENPSGQFDQMIISDLDGDGKLDLVATYAAISKGFYVYKNTSVKGSISFKLEYNLVHNEYPSSMMAGDVNGDGKPELLVTDGGSNTLSIFKNLSTSSAVSFGAKTTYNVGGNTSSVALGELDGDGKPDIALISNKQLTVFKNTGIGTEIAFDKKKSYPVSREASLVALSDYNKDGKLDISIADGSAADNSEPTINILLNQFSQPIIKGFSTTSGPSGLTMILDGSKLSGASKVTIGGVPATSFTVLSDNQINVKVSDSHAGTIAVSTPYGTAVLEGYRMGDAIPEVTSFNPNIGPVGTIVQIQGSAFSNIPSENVVYFGGVRANVVSAEANSLTVTVPFGAGYNPISVTRNQLTGLSRYPFKVSHAITEPSLIKAFANKITIQGSNYSQVATADLDGDGNLDLVISGLRVNMILMNTGNRALPFVETGKMQVNELSGKISLADFDGDGKVDVISPDRGSGLVCYRNTSTIGKISFEESRIPIPGGYSGDGIAFADFDKDGKLDVVFTNAAYHTISVLLNIGEAGKIAFATRKDYIAGIGVTGVCTGDFDGDGRSDIAVCNTNTNTISLFRNRSVYGQLNFEDKKDFSADAGPRDIATGDLDGDGKLDIVVCNYSLPAGMGPFTKGFALRNTSTSGVISFAAKVSFTTGPYAQGIKLADMNSDGLPDLLYADWYEGFVGVNFNKSVNGTLSFANHQIIPVNNVEPKNLTDVVVGDWNNDGKPDLAAVGTHSEQLNYFINEGSPAKPVITAEGPLTFNMGGKVVLRVSNMPGFSFQWLKGGTVLPGATGLNYTATEEGVYQVRATNGAYSVVSDGIAVTTIFNLPANNFKISTTASTCVGKKDGRIKVEAVLPLNYTVTLTGDQMIVKAFNATAEFGGLGVGTYSLCIVVENQPEYKQCYTLVLTEPKPLSVQTAITDAGSKVTLTLNGAENYYIELNGKSYTTKASSIELPLNTGNNQLSVITDQLCQGKVERLIVNAKSPAPFPNPVEGTLYIDIGDTKLRNMVLKVYETASGKLVKSARYSDRSGLIELDCSDLIPGIYTLTLDKEGLRSVFKVMKK